MNKERNEKLVVILTIVLFIALLYFCSKVFNLLEFSKVNATYSVYAVEIPEILKNENPVDIKSIIEANRNIDVKEEITYEEQDLEYTTQYINNEKLPSGTIHVSQIGINGKQDVITIKRFKNDELISEQIVANNVKKSSVNKIVEIGTGKRKKQI